MLPTELITKALALCGKSMEDMYIMRKQASEHIWTVGEFSIEKFCYYLLSPEFIEKYTNLYIKGIASEIKEVMFFGQAIYYYQKGDPEPLTLLLQKI